MAVIHDRAASIDIGSRFNVVAVPADLTEEPMRTFKALTANLEQMACWLVDLGITTVAMEQTGAYWILVYEILESHGGMSCWPMRGMHAQFRDAKPTLTMHNGSSVYMLVVCYVPASILIEKSPHYADIFACESATLITRLHIPIDNNWVENQVRPWALGRSNWLFAGSLAQLQS